MGQVDENLNALDDDVVRLLTLNVGDETDAAGVVLEARVVQALSLGRYGSESRSSHRMRPCVERLSLIRTQK
jgi:hypothetical protein